jgi:cell division protein FtsB
MTQQISVEDALAAFREQHGKLADENVLLRAQATGLERERDEALAENARLRGAQPPASGGPDLASQPPYPTDEQG